MAKQISLEDLIEALSNAVIEAQDRIEQHQIKNLARYFDADNRPVSVEIILPSALPGQEDGVPHMVPLLALVATNPLRIKDVEISFDAEIGELGTFAAERDGEPAEPEDTSDEKAWRARVPKRSVKVDMQPGLLRSKGKSAHVVLRVEGCEPTEGMSRLINHLLKLI